MMVEPEDNQTFTGMLLESCKRVILFKSSKRLVNAIHADDIDEIRRIIERHRMLGDVEITDDGHTALTLASSVGYPRTVKALIKLKVSVNSQNRTDGMSALHHAVKSKPTNRDHVIEVVEELLNAYAKVDTNAYVETVGMNGIKYAAEETPLMYAVHNENLAITELLIKHGADVNHTDSLCGYTPLLRAAGTGNLAIINLLLAKGADVHAISAEGNNVLHWLAHSQIDTVRCLNALVEHGAYINEVNSRGRSALMIAARAHKPRMCSALIGLGASISCKDNHGLTAYDFATAAESHTCMDIIKNAYKEREKTRKSNKNSIKSQDSDNNRNSANRDVAENPHNEIFSTASNGPIAL